MFLGLSSSHLSFVSLCDVCQGLCSDIYIHDHICIDICIAYFVVSPLCMAGAFILRAHSCMRAEYRAQDLIGAEPKNNVKHRVAQYHF